MYIFPTFFPYFCNVSETQPLYDLLPGNVFPLQEVETKVADALKELELFRSVTESNLSELETEINGLLTAEYLEARCTYIQTLICLL